MYKKILLTLLVGALIGGGSVAWYEYTKDRSSIPTLNIEENTQTAVNMPPSRSGHMAQMQQMFVTSERAFIEHMIPHHQEAIDTAREVLERGATTEAVRELMNNIIAAQTTEVAEMKVWYEEWYGESYQDTGEYEPMMHELVNLSGAELDRAFLEDMIMHHMGAIMMARSVQPYIEHNEIAELTQNIVTTQSAEIALMRSLLQTL